MLLTDFGLFAYGRHPNEMGCALWWSGKLWPWLLVVAAIVTCATRPAELCSGALNAAAAILNSTSSLVANNATLDTNACETSALRDPRVLSWVAAVLFVTWLVSLVAFFVLAKRNYWSTFWNNETAAEYTKRVKWDGEPNDKRRAMLLVRVHPGLLRLVAPEARIWIQSNWKRWSKDQLDWLTDRWKRALPDSVLSQQVLWELGGHCRSAAGPH